MTTLNVNGKPGELDIPEETKAEDMSSSHSAAVDTDGVIQEWFMALEYVARTMGRADESADVARVRGERRGVPDALQLFPTKEAARR